MRALTAGAPRLILVDDVDRGGQWFTRELPQATVEVWPGSGHFPHLAHLARFATRLAATGRW